MICFLHRFLIICIMGSLVSCDGRAYTMTQFPWKMVGEGAIQESANDALSRETEYYGNIRIVHPRRKLDSNGRPKKQKTIVEIFGFLRKDRTPILKKSFSLYAYDLHVVERNGTASDCDIVLEDTADNERWVIQLAFDPSAKTLEVKKLSPNVRS